MPPGIFPPLVLCAIAASNVPILQASLWGAKRYPEQQLFDLATNNLRPGMATVPGAQIPYPYGGASCGRDHDRCIDPEKLYAWNLVLPATCPMR